MRFKLDENMPAEAADLLGNSGHDVHSVYDEGLGGADDQAIAQAVRQEWRILITLDLDFADIRLYPPGSITASSCSASPDRIGTASWR